MAYKIGVAKSLAASLIGAGMLGANASGCTSDRVYDLASRYEGTYSIVDFINRNNLWGNGALAVLGGGLVGLVFNALRSDE